MDEIIRENLNRLLCFRNPNNNELDAYLANLIFNYNIEPEVANFASMDSNFVRDLVGVKSRPRKNENPQRINADRINNLSKNIVDLSELSRKAKNNTDNTVIVKPFKAARKSCTNSNMPNNNEINNIHIQPNNNFNNIDPKFLGKRRKRIEDEDEDLYS
jgi:hypothetical protein